MFLSYHHHPSESNLAYTGIKNGQIKSFFRSDNREIPIILSKKTHRTVCRAVTSKGDHVDMRADGGHDDKAC